MKHIGSPTSFNCRIVLIGNTNVGKTAILNQLIDQSFSESFETTIGANYQLYVQEINGVKVEIQIWDTSGQEKFRSLGPIYYRNALGAVLVFDLTNKNSFESVPDWITEFTDVATQDTSIFIVANKIDLDSKEVQSEEARNWTINHGYKYFETSAKTGSGVKELFQEIATDILKNRMIKQREAATTTLVENDSQCGC